MYVIFLTTHGPLIQVDVQKANLLICNFSGQKQSSQTKQMISKTKTRDRFGQFKIAARQRGIASSVYNAILSEANKCSYAPYQLYSPDIAPYDFLSLSEAKTKP
jgi:hypothetical protein